MIRSVKFGRNALLVFAAILTASMLPACSKQEETKVETAKSAIPASHPKSGATGGSSKMTEEPDAPAGTKLGTQGGLK